MENPDGKKPDAKKLENAPLPSQVRTNYGESLMHFFKGNLGVGLFAMGGAFKNGGIYVASFFSLLLAVVCVHCMRVLLVCTDKAHDLYAEGTQDLDYADAIKLCFENGPKKLARASRAMGIICNVCIAMTQLGFCCIYLVFIAVSIKEILAIYNIYVNLHLLMFIVWIPICLCCLITQLKRLAVVSMVSNVALLSGLIIVMYFALKDGLPNLKERRPYTDLEHTVLSLGTIVFTYEGVALVLPIKNAMKKPRDFMKPFGVLNVGMTMVVILYNTSGFIGYWKWGEEVGGTMTSNLGSSIFAQCTKGLVALAITLTYPLQFFVPMTTMVPYVVRKCNCVKSKLFCELIFRTLISMGTLVIAEAFPEVGVFISLIGGLSSTILAMIFPPIMECLLLKETVSRKWLVGFKICKNVIILIIAVFIVIMGTYASIIEVVAYFKKKN